jgi:predicted ATP-dependent endonuclease of OLD family
MKQDCLSEELVIKKFLSLRDTSFEISSFNIITGDMASGKSLIMKLMEFFEGILIDLFAQPYDSFLKNLDIGIFYEKAISKFTDKFYLGSKDFDVSYKCYFKKSKLELGIRIFRNEGNESISMESKFLSNELPEWEKYCKENKAKTKTPDGQDEIKVAIYKSLSKKFGGKYPIATTFVPAARAILAMTESGNSNFWDYYLKNFNSFAEFLFTRSSNSEYENKIKKILKARVERRMGITWLISDDGREVPLSKASSGQQEIFYILLLLSRLFTFKFYYGRRHYIFIEEPEAHLFPLGQKLVLEFICEIFNKEDGFPMKVFITTHSPYVLNVVNNMLAKGNIISEFPDYEEDILKDKESKDIPILRYEDVSAVFVKENGNIEKILDKFDEGYLINPEVINDISIRISDDRRMLKRLKIKFEAKK